MIQHSITWCKGEIFEGKLIVAFGLILCLIAFFLNRLGHTPTSKAMIWPLAIMGISFSVIGTGMVYNNNQRIVKYSKRFQEEPAAFVLAEQQRTDIFIAWYPKTRYLLAILTFLGVGLFLYWSSPLGRAIAPSMILFALTGFVIDHFSEERAEIYHQHILTDLRSHSSLQ